MHFKVIITKRNSHVLLQAVHSLTSSVKASSRNLHLKKSSNVQSRLHLRSDSHFLSRLRTLAIKIQGSIKNIPVLPARDRGDHWRNLLQGVTRQRLAASSRDLHHETPKVERTVILQAALGSTAHRSCNFFAFRLITKTPRPLIRKVDLSLGPAI